MRVSYHGRHEQPYEPFQFYPDLVAMARDVDWLVVLAPGSASTRGIVSREVLRALGPEGALVNVARGSLVDEPAMVELLPAAGSAAPRSTSSPTSRACPERFSRCRTSCSRRTRARRPKRPAAPWAIW